ncbi:hypothetical protein FG386_001813 [Cryptosporidium ryanae]|uniref:uncharacterized protein n=1 Tax=Cryptosporidium ryanae TaxID=515981 RepID=UPI00351A0A23|nr:hypothetical protein FG386_001813 [Cryptosporidium ryanae]
MEEKNTILTSNKPQAEIKIGIPIINVKKSEHLDTENQTGISIQKLPSIKSMTEIKTVSENVSTDKKSSGDASTANSSSSSRSTPPTTNSSSPPPTTGSSPPPTTGSSPPPTTGSSPPPASGSSTPPTTGSQKSTQGSGDNATKQEKKELIKANSIKKEESYDDKYKQSKEYNKEYFDGKGGYYNSSKVELELIGGKLGSRRGFENEKYSLIESELDSKFPEFSETFTGKGIPEVKIAFIFTLICLIIVIGFSIRKYRKLKKAGEQVRNVTNTVFPVKIVSLYLYIFLGFPLSVITQFLSCISPLGFGMYNVVQTIYQSASYIWLWDLFVEYFGGSEQIVTAIRRTGPYYLWKVPPFMLTTGGETYFQPKTLIVSYILVFQYLFVNIMVGIVNVTHPSKALFFNVFQIISLTILVYGIMLVYWPSKEALQPYQGGWKFGILLLQSISIIVIDSIIRLARYENREYNSIVYKMYWRMMLVCGVSTICTLAAVAIIDSREIYKIYNLPLPIKITESSENNNQESKGMLAT